jgi:hypothetical protein
VPSAAGSITSLTLHASLTLTRCTRTPILPRLPLPPPLPLPFPPQDGGDFLLGAQYSLAEAMTAPFAVRMLANFAHHRALRLLELSAALGCGRLGRWLTAVAARPSTVLTTPAHASLVQLPPYLQKAFVPFEFDAAEVGARVAEVNALYSKGAAAAAEEEAAFQQSIKSGVALAQMEREKRHAAQAEARAEAGPAAKL